MDLKPVIVLGTGGHSKVVAESLRMSGRKIIGFLSPEFTEGSSFFGGKVLGNDDKVFEYSVEDIELANGIGALPGNRLREKLAKIMRDHGYRFSQVIHPAAIVSQNVDLEEGVQIFAGAVVQPGCKIGRDVIINTGALIDHDCLIQEGSHVAPGVVCSGNVTLGKRGHIGTGARVIQNITIGDYGVVAAGTTVYKDVKENSLVRQQLQTVVEKKGHK